MARKNVNTHKIITATAMSGNITSNVTNVQFQDQATILLEWSAGSTPVGTITVEAKQGTNGNWVTLDFNDTISISGNSGSHAIVFNSLPFDFVRVVYTRASGSGTLDATITHKSVGA